MNDRIDWNGKTHSYLPPSELRIDPCLRLHDEAAAEPDPVTHEVLRHALWHVNTEHGSLLMRVSGSPIAAYAHDFNTVIMDELGDFVFYGPYMQFLTSPIGHSVKWALENRAANPGIGPGDIFLFNDPWIGGTHQNDVGVMAPVFVEGRLFCWVGCSLHQWDTGGTVPGGFNPQAEDVFWESACIPPVKIVEGGTIRQDVADQYTRISRLPDLVSLDLRAQLTGARASVEQIGGLVERYGAAAVKGTMRKIQDDSEAAFQRRLATIPDGVWSAEGWLEAALPGDRGLYKNRLSVEKREGELIFSNAGSAAQVGTLSTTLSAWTGAIACMLNSQFLFDQMFCVEGALRHCRFEPEPGTISVADYPASVSACTALICLHTINLGGLVISKMLSTSSDEELRTEVQGSMGCMMVPVNSYSGTDQRGAPFASVMLDHLGAALAAMPWSDGQDTGGWPWDLQSTMPNVEDTELFSPLLYLWRKELPDSGGAGRFRGGNGGEVAVVPHRVESIDMATIGGQIAVPAPGLFGGYPTSTNSYRHIVGAGLLERVRRSGRMPTSVEEIEAGETSWPTAKSFGMKVTRDDVWMFSWAGAGGYGDPLERDPERVRLDVEAGRVSREWAHRAYGVVIDDGDEPVVDAEATASAREEIRRLRLAEGALWDGAPPSWDARLRAS